MKYRLTDISIKKLSYSHDGQVTYWDELTPGFGIRCSTRSKSFVVMYGPKRRLKTIGRYPNISLADARKTAKEVLIGFTASPSEQELQSISFAQAKNIFLKDCGTRNKIRTVKDYKRLLNKHFKINKPLNEIKRAHVMKVVLNLSATPSEQAHAFVAIRTMFNWCVKQGLLDANPMPPMSHKQTNRDRILSNEELTIVYQRAKDFEYPFGQIVQLIILTGQRRSEIAALRRSWIIENQIIFPEGFTKNKRVHRVPLPKSAKTLIDELPNLGDLLFPSRLDIEKPFNGWGKCKKRFDEPIDVAPYTLHDLRRTFSSNMAQLNVPIHVTEKILNHISGTVSGVAAVYNRYSYMDEMVEAMGKYDTQLTKKLFATADADL